MDFLKTKQMIEEMMQKDYKTFVTALISIENQDALDMIYQKFMNTDEMHLLNEEFDEMIKVVSV